jgi:hypothetical protein
VNTQNFEIKIPTNHYNINFKMNQPRNWEGDGSQQCQKCLEIGHWSYQCKNPRVYAQRQSRTENIGKQKKMKIVKPPPILNTYSTHDIDTMRHKKIFEEKEKLLQELENLKKTEEVSESSSESDSSDISSDSSDLSSSSSSSSSDSDSEVEENEKKLKKVE